MSKYTNFDLRNFISEGKKAKEDNMEESAPGFEHDCAAHVVHETYGYGVCIEGKHTLVETTEGKAEVTHYDVFFKNGDTVENVPVNELKVLTSESHTHGKSKKKNEETLEEADGPLKGLMNVLTKVFDKVTGIDKFSECQASDWQGEECQKLKREIGYAAGVKSGFEKQAGAKIYEEEAKLTKEEAFKKQIKDLLDS